MRASDSASEFVKQALEGKDRDLQRLAAAGLAPIGISDLLALQVRLSETAEVEIAKMAVDSLLVTDPRIVASVIAEQGDEEVVRFFGSRADHPAIVESVLRRRDVPRDLLEKMAGTLVADMQELLLLRQDAIVESPRILDALEENKSISSYSTRRILEYREHLLPKESVAPEEIDPDDVVDEEAVKEINEEFEKIEKTGEVAEVTDLFKASEIKIRLLSVATRMKLARGAGSLMRRLLIRDQNPLVATAVLRFSPIQESEVEKVALSRVVVDDVLAEIARSRRWMRSYKVVHSLCQNPRTPLNVTVRTLPRLSTRHLLQLSRNRNVPETLRSRALRLYRIKIR